MSRCSRHLDTTLKYSLLIVCLVTHTSLRHCVASRTHIIRASDVATTLATLALMLALLYASLRLEMLAGHVLSCHVILGTARLIHLIMLSSSAHRAMMLLGITRSISMVLLTFVLAATLDRNSRL